MVKEQSGLDAILEVFSVLNSVPQNNGILKIYFPKTVYRLLESSK